MTTHRSKSSRRSGGDVDARDVHARTARQLEARREEVGEDKIAAIEREWAELLAQMKAHRDAGTDPSDPEVRSLAER
jgi:hypothetical protein